MATLTELSAAIAACAHFLDAQLAAIKPKIVVTLGRYSMAKFFPSETISRVHGVARKMADMVVVPMYHPAAALHQQSLRKTIEADFQKLPQVLASLEPVEETAPEPQQLSMF